MVVLLGRIILMGEELAAVGEKLEGSDMPPDSMEMHRASGKSKSSWEKTVVSIILFS